MKFAFALFLSALFALPATAQDLAPEDIGEIYDSFVICAAFHTVESTRTQGDAASAQQAIAYDFANAATLFAPDRLTATVDADLKKRLDDYSEKLETGEPRAMAEQWTALESSCRELYPARAALVERRTAELEKAAP